MLQTIIVAIIVLAAVAWLVWSLVRSARTGACGSCAGAKTCPHLRTGVCPGGECAPPPDEDE